MIFLDVETTGLNPRKHSLLSIGGVVYPRSTQEKYYNSIQGEICKNPKEFYEECKVRDGAEITEEALNVNNFTRDNIRDENKKSEEGIINDFFDWAKRVDPDFIVGKRPRFDESFIQAGGRYETDGNLDYNLLDLGSLAFLPGVELPHRPEDGNGGHIPGTDVFIEFAGLPPRGEHHALEDAELEAEIYHRFLNGEPWLEKYSGYPVPDYLKQQSYVTLKA